MKNELKAFAFGICVLLGMGITMPQCPAQQAMQQQLDESKLKEADLTRRLAALEANVRTMSADVGAMKTSTGPIIQQLQAMSPRLDALEAAVKVLQTPPPAPAKGAKGRRH
jgi:hypothetical protein